MGETKLSATNGHIIAGTLLNKHEFIGRVSTAQLFQLAPDPRDAENQRKRDSSKELQDVNEVRSEVQRLFEGAKKKNVDSFADYIVNLHSEEGQEGEDGITPPITLYTDQKLTYAEGPEGTGWLQIPWAVNFLVAIDGETQLAARYEASNRAPETKSDFVAVHVCFDRDVLWARQAFHDLNALAVRPNAALSMGMDARDPITKVCREVERNVHLFAGKVNKVRRQLRPSDVDLVTLPALRGACVTLAKGISGIGFGARPVPIEANVLADVEATALTWFNAVTQAIGTTIEMPRSLQVTTAPAVLAAIGAMGNQLIGTSAPQRAARAAEMAASLKLVDWRKGPHWAGIAGKVNAKGVLSVGGSKENAYSVYAALVDPSNPGYAAVRHLEAKAAGKSVETASA